MHMSHSIITTPGFVLSSRPYGEAGRLVSILTRELGLILAGAQGIRLEKSKLRYSSQDYVFGDFSFVRGREFWRLTDAKSDGSSIGSRAKIELYVKIALILKRLLQGEEAHPHLFDTLLAWHRFMVAEGELSRDELESVESLIVARILERLGYVGDDPALDKYVKTDELSRAMTRSLGVLRRQMNIHINRALKESHL